MEELQEVFIKELHESGIDQVFYVQNLPKKFIYHKVPKMVVRYDRDGYTDGTTVVDPSGEKEDGLLEGLEHSQNGDSSIVFPMSKESARNALLAIDQYISGTLPRDVVIPKRTSYPMDSTNSRSMPKTRNLIPTVILPVSREPLVEVSPEANPSPSKRSRILTQEQKEAARERMARARAVKAAQLSNKANAPQE
jgi:hypothetical protein